MSSINRPLVVDTLRAHRWGILGWVGGGAVAMVTIAAGFASEVSRFAGGAKALGASMQASAEAMRLLRWPAERLDTLGGYLTYHNVTLFGLALSVYAAVQGAHAVRGAESAGMAGVILAAGRSRAGLLVDRAVGFTLTLAAISVGLGAGLALAMALGGQPDAGGGLITGLALGSCALASYAIGALVCQLLPSATAGAGASALLISALYLLTNVWPDIGPLGLARFASPFFYANFSRALVPGYGLDLFATAALLAGSVAVLAGAAGLARRRDYAAGVWHPRPRQTGTSYPVQRRALRSVWSAILLRQRLGLLTWSLATAAYLALMAWMEPAVADLWDEFHLTEMLIGADPRHSVADMYLSFAGQLVVAAVAAYVITQAAGWVNDLRQGRVELELAAPLSWSRLVGQRLLATMVGAAVVTVVGLAGLAGTAAAIGIELDAAGLIRTVAVTVLLAVALAAVAAVVVAWLRSTAAVAALGIFVAASYLLLYLVPLFGWPSWVARITVFGAYGNPYLDIPAWTGLTVLAVMAAGGTVAAAAIAERTPKVAS